MINLLKKYLDISQYSIDKENFEEYYHSHPNFPSLFAVTDSLDVLNIENLSVKIPKTQFEALPDQFICLYEKEFVLVTKKEHKVSIEKENGIKTKLTLDEFIAGWDEIVLLIEPNSQIAPVSRKNTFMWWYALPIAIVLGLSVAFQTYDYVSYLLLGTSLLGVLMSIFIVQESFGVQNQTVSKFCKLSAQTSCDSVITSSEGKVFKGVSLSDLPLLFFSTTFLALLLKPEFVSRCIVVLSVISLPMVGYSIWLQKIKIKKWCVLCLAVSVVLIIQSLGVVLSRNISESFFMSSNIFFLVYPAVIITSFWFVIKSILNKQKDSENENRQLKKFKRNFEVFQFLSKDVPVYEGFETLSGIKFGSKTAPLKVTLILSPSCGHCHTAFKEAYELVKASPQKMRLKILFNVNPDNEENPYRTVVLSLLSLSKNCPELVEIALVDWHINRLELKVWESKWGMQTQDLLANHETLKQYNWCQQNEFNYTPVKLVNGKQFPNEYAISELKYFINNFSEEALQGTVLQNQLQ